jgi:hypothetical protein
MIWSSSLPVGTLAVGWLTLALVLAVVARLVIRGLVPARSWSLGAAPRRNATVVSRQWQMPPRVLRIRGRPG